MTSFRNAYHFIPRKPKAHGPFPNAHGFGKDGNQPLAGHAAYAEDGLSGVFRCRLTLEQPTVIGAERKGGGPTQYAVVTPFTFCGRPAIPATSLKGVISALAEAASQGIYRVLSDDRLTVAYGARELARRKDVGTVHAYVDPDLRPGAGFGMVEGMFGFVRDGAPAENELPALAGKLRWSHALLDGENAAKPESVLYLDGDFEGENFDGKRFGNKYVRLKELSQPMKPWPEGSATHRSATPNFYMREKEGASAQHITKKDFADRGPGSYAIQGQKAYLHHAAARTPDAQPWKTAASVAEDKTSVRGKAPAQRKSVVRPLRAGTSFEFTIRFDNLSEAELALLCFSLKPSERFRHKIGYAKPLGLGSVNIEPIALALIDRKQRYCGASVYDTPAQPGNELPALWQAKAKAHDQWLQDHDKPAWKAIHLIGETHNFDKAMPDASAVPVLWVPLTEDKFVAYRDELSSAEGESFKWFQDNDKTWRQRLVPIAAETGKLPVLYDGYPPPPPLPQAPSRRAAGATVVGEVRGYNAEKGYCHVRLTDGGNDVFVPANVIRTAGIASLTDGQSVQVMITQSRTNLTQWSATRISLSAP